MANNRIQFSLDFARGDTSALQGLKRDIAEIQKLASDIDFTADLDPNQLKSMVSAAQALDKALNNAFDVDLNTINIDRFNKSLAQSGFNAKSLQSALNHCGITGQQAFLKTTAELMKFGTTAKQTNKFLDGIATTFLNTARWSAVSSVINSVGETIQNSFSYIKGLDTSLNDIRIVTGKSADEMSRFATEANNAAKSLAVSTRDYTEGSLIYYQQGLDDETVKTLTDITAKTSNVTGQGMDEVSEQLTAVWNGYQVANEAAKEGMDTYEEYVDKMAAVGAATASDLQELSVAMSKVASAANAMGVDFDDLNAQIATIVSVTRQAPESVGTALKTIYARLGDLQVDGVDEFGVSLGKVGEQMAQMGIQILDQQGNLRDMSSVIAEVAEKWDTWTSAQRQAAAVAMAGKRQYNNLIALFDNWDMYGEALNTSMNAAGTLEEQQEIALDSLSNKMEILKATAEDLYDSLFDDSSLKGLVSAGTAGLQLLADLTDGLGGLKTILPMLGGAFLNVFNQQIGSALGAVVNNVRNANKEIDSAKQNAEQLQLMFSGNQMFEGEGIEGSAQAKALEDLTSYYNEMQQYQGIMTAEEKEQYNLILETKVAIGNRRIELEQEEESWNNINTKLKLINGQLHQNDDAIREQANSLMRAAQTLRDFRNINTNIKADNFNFDDLVNDLGLAENQVGQLKSRFEELRNGGNSVDEALDRIIIDLEQVGGGASNIIRTTQALNSEAEAARNTANALREQKQVEKEIGDFSKFLGGLGQVTSGIISLINLTKVWEDENTSAGEKITQTMLALTMTIPMIVAGFKAMGISGTTTFAELVTGALSGAAANAKLTISTITATAATEGLGAAIMATPVGWILAGLAVVTAGIIAAVKIVDYLSQANERAAQEAENYAKQMSSAYTQIADAARNAKNEIENYYDAKNALGELTTGTEEWKDAVFDLNNQVTALIDKYPELAKGLDITNGVMSINEETLKEFTEGLKKQQANVGLMQTSANEVSTKKGQIVDREKSFNNNIAKKETYIRGYDTSTAYTEKEKEALIAQGADPGEFTLQSQTIQKLNLSLEQYNKIIDLIKKDGENALKEQSNLAEYLGIDAKTEKALLEDKEFQASLMQQVNNEIANEVQLRAQRNAAISQYLTTNAGDEYQNLLGSENEEDQSLAAAVNYAVTKKLSTNSRRVADELNALAEQTDDQIESLWAEQFNYKKNDKGKYEDSEGREVEFNAEAARQQLAEVNAAEKLVEQDLGSVISGVKTAMNNLDEGYKKGLNEFLQGGGTDNLSAGLRKNILEAAEFDVTGDTLQRLLGLSDEDLNALGYKSGKTFKDALVNAINESDTSLEAFKNQLSQGAKDAINDLPSYFGAGQSNADIKQLYSDLDEANEVGGSVALAALTEKFSEGSTSALEFSNAIKDIDWASFNNVNDAVEKLERQGVVTDKDREIVKAYADQMILAAQAAQVLEEKLDEDVDEDEYKALAEYLGDASNEIEGLSDDLRDNQDAIDDLAEELLRYDSALADVIDNYDEWEKLLKSDNIQDNVKAAEQLKNTYADLLDLNPESLSQGFLTSIENLKLLKEAANGSEKAYNSLAEAASKDILIQCGIDTTQFEIDKDTIMNEIAKANLDFDKLEIGANLDVGNVYSELENIINAAGMTAREAEDYLAGMGIDAEVETSDPQTKAVVTTNQYWEPAQYSTTPISTGGEESPGTWDALTLERVGHWQPVTEAHYEESAPAAYALKIKSAHKASGGGFKFKNSSHGGGSAGRAARKPSGGGRKGGGGKKGGGKGKEKDKKDKPKNEKDRYYEINNTLNTLSSTLDKIDKQKEHLAGNALAKKLTQENKVINEQIKAYRVLAKIQDKESDAIQKRLKKQGAKFDKNGNFVNYSKIYNQELKRYQDAVEKFNKSKQTKKDEKELEKAEKRYKKFVEDTERNASLQEERRQTAADKEAARLQKIANNYEKWDVKLNVKLDKKEFKRDWLEFVQEINDDFKLEFPDITVRQKNHRKIANTYAGKGGTLDLDEQKIADIEAELKKLEAGKKSKMFATKSEAKEALKEAKKVYIEDVKAFNELRQEVWNDLIDGIEQAADRFDLLQESFEKLNDELSYQKELIELIYGPEAYDLMDSYYKAQEQASLNQINSLKQQADMWEQQFKNSGADKKDRLEWTKEEVTYYENWKNAEEEMKDNVLEHIKLIKEDYLNAVDNTLLTLEKELNGGKTFEEVEKEWDRISKDADKYYDSVEKAYEIQSLANKMDKEIASTKDLKNQQKLQKIRDEEIAILKEKDKLTEYDVKKAQAKYDIALKEIALENSRNNKNSMKLTRNAQGNWSYQYVADTSDLESKQQDVLDSIHNLYELASDGYTKNLQELQDLKKEYHKTFKEISQDESLTIQERNKKIEELNEQFYTQQKILAEENSMYREDLTKASAGVVWKVYEKDKKNYEFMTTEEKKLIDALIDPNNGSIPKDYNALEISVSTNLNNIKILSEENMKKTREDWSSSTQQMADYWNSDGGFSVKTSVTKAFNAIINASVEFNTSLLTLQSTSGQLFSKDGITGGLEKASSAAEQLNTDTTNMVKNLVGEDGVSGQLGKLKSGVEAIEQAWAKVNREISKYLEKEVKNIDAGNILDTANKYSNPEGLKGNVQNNLKNSIEDVKNLSEVTKNEDTSSKIKESLKKNTEENTKAKGVAAAIWFLSNYGGWGEGSTRKKRLAEKNIDYNKVQEYFNGTNSAKNTSDLIPLKNEAKKYKYGAFKTGGYTGSWGEEGRWAVLHQKELVLNKEDTKNFLEGINTIRDMSALNGSISNSIAKAVANMMVTLSKQKLGNFDSGTEKENTSNVFNITAEFPNAENVNEIREAILSLPNIASQYAAKNKM